jgi:hypothetical protein
MWRRIVLAECGNVKIGRSAFISILASAARARPTVTSVRFDRTLVRPAPLRMMRVIVMACRVVPGFTPAKDARREKGFCDAQ